MPGDNLVRDLLEIAVLVALGGMVCSAVRRLKAGRVHVYRCHACARPTSRAYPDCRHCGVTRPGRPPERRHR
jgi:rRNA maturation endonuclease Nob1